ncbi:hypothetical protein GUJ93_ZPchr0008g13321 [Zizania palustris]|uniref:Uncharacterized protein n=1 Tax=Zizania palustris TaxID=103762 RepID=A0A8J5R3J6_ZIZPA|nr:hypothetical protein GUJ93_ZPchr0008g13321 [Zizania palustris]
MQPRRRNAGDQRLRDAANGEQRSRCVGVRAGADSGGARSIPMLQTPIVKIGTKDIKRIEIAPTEMEHMMTLKMVNLEKMGRSISRLFLDQDCRYLMESWKMSG